MAQADAGRWAMEVGEQLGQRFGAKVAAMAPIEQGWLNAKWRADTEEGALFVKAYHPDRYKLHLRPERRAAIERTLRLQHGLREAGVPCPGVRASGGAFLQETASGIIYTVQDWTEGTNVRAGEMSVAHMYELGLATGRMHRWLRSVSMLDKPGWEPDRGAYLREWEANRAKAAAAGDETTLEWLRRSQRIAEAANFSEFEAMRPGWLHWDLWADNLIFDGSRLAGIVDFDRMTTAYPDIDVGRAILSGALTDDGELRGDAVGAFMSGYRECVEAPEGMLARALRMIYLIESIWWLRTEVRAESELRALLARFVREMHWLEDHWGELEEAADGA
ncbi:phosphotransferase [Paenibacillus sp. TRM 82003]|nr:phosphotransferase [Paenibacillus sp. TRM 82003]